MSSSKLVFAPLSYTGWGSLENLLPEVRKAEAMRILIVTDPQLVEIGLTRNVTVPLEEEGFDITLYTEVVPEPASELRRTGREGDALVAQRMEKGLDH